MSSIIDTEKRFAFPKWKTYQASLDAGEMELIGSKRIIEFKDSFNKEMDSNLISNWKKDKNMVNAAEILNYASMHQINENNTVKEIASYILSNKEAAGQSLYDLALRFFSDNSDDESEILLDNDNYKLNILVFSQIRRYKRMLEREPNFHIGWIELARFFVLIANVDKAKRCIDTALHLSRQNRYVVRSAARFYIHIGEYDRALDILIKSSHGKDDPWILSSIIAVTTKLNKKTNYLSSARKMVKETTLTPFETSELKSSLATSEQLLGNFKEARTLYNQALTLPTDNSLAQVLWYNYVENEDQNLLFQKVHSPYEAKTVGLYRDENYQESFNNNLKWILDEPFSSRPLNIASYNASVFLNDHEESVNIEKLGLSINPDDEMLQNNLVFDLIMCGRIEEAQGKIQKFEQKRFNDLNPRSTWKATKGLLNYRLGNTDLGRLLYKEAINDFKVRKNDYMETLAFIYFAREEFLSDSDDSQTLLKQLVDQCKNREEKDIKKMYKEVKQLGETKLQNKNGE